MRVVILVPRRDGNPERDLLWTWAKPHWSELGFDIIEGHHDEGYFNRSLAINRASQQAGDWDVAIIIDSDVVIPERQVRAGIAAAVETGQMVLPFTVRREMSESITRKMINNGYGPKGDEAYRVFNDSCSSVVIVTRELWDKVQGFDPAFVGWGCEDNAFSLSCETFSGKPMLKLQGDVTHLYHAGAPEGRNTTPTYQANYVRYGEYLRSHGSTGRTARVRASGVAPKPTGIPRILHRIVLGEEPPKAAAYWRRFRELHPDWRLITHRDPLNPDAWPLTAPHWDKAISIVQIADMLRFEILLRWGGIYVDWDVEPMRPFDPLLGLESFAAWQDPKNVAFGVIGAPAEHPAIRAALDEMLARIDAGDPTGQLGGWKFIAHCGNNVVTKVWPGRSDMLLLPPGTFYPYYYNEKNRANEKFDLTAPWSLAVHHWWASWLDGKGRIVPISSATPARPEIDPPIPAPDAPPSLPNKRPRRNEVKLY